MRKPTLVSHESTFIDGFFRLAQEFNTARCQIDGKCHKQSPEPVECGATRRCKQRTALIGAARPIVVKLLYKRRKTIGIKRLAHLAHQHLVVMQVMNGI